MIRFKLLSLLNSIFTFLFDRFLPPFIGRVARDFIKTICESYKTAIRLRPIAHLRHAKSEVIAYRNQTCKKEHLYPSIW